MFRNKLTGTIVIIAGFVVVLLFSMFIYELLGFLPAAIIVLAFVVNVVMLLSMPPKEEAQEQNH